jgi:hypothetical protein
MTADYFNTGVRALRSCVPTECVMAALRWSRTYVVVVPAAIIFGVVVGARFIQPLVDRPPTLNSFRKLDETTKPNGFLRFVVKPELFDASRCTGTLDRMYLEPIRVDGIAMWQQMRPAIVGSPLLAMNLPPPPPDLLTPAESDTAHGAADMGCGREKCYVAAVPLPRGATPGPWGYMAITTFDCGFWGGGLRTFQTGPIWFDVMADNEGK